MLIHCVACKRHVGYPPNETPKNCAYCGEAFPEKPVEVPLLLLGAMPMPPPPTRPYRLSENDRRFLKSLRIMPEV